MGLTGEALLLCIAHEVKLANSGYSFAELFASLGAPVEKICSFFGPVSS